MLIGAVIFAAIGFDGPHAVYEIFFTPIVASYKWQDVAAKAAPLIMIALGLSLGNQAKVWNIGAEGQYIIGALARRGRRAMRPAQRDGSLDHAADDRRRHRRRHGLGGDPGVPEARASGVNEILSSLMLVYVALQVLNYLIGGPWKDPNGHNFPQTPPFTDGAGAAARDRRNADSARPRRRASC